MALTELEKVAIFLVAIGPARAEGILKRLGTDGMVQVAGAMKRLGPITPAMRRAVLKEMLDHLSGQLPSGGPSPARAFARDKPQADPEADLLDQVSALFDRDVDVRNLNWDAAGLTFDTPPLPPDDEESGPGNRPGRRF